MFEQQYTSCIKVSSGANFDSSRECHNKLVGPMLYSWWNCPLNIPLFAGIKLNLLQHIGNVLESLLAGTCASEHHQNEHHKASIKTSNVHIILTVSPNIENQRTLTFALRISYCWYISEKDTRICGMRHVFTGVNAAWG